MHVHKKTDVPVIDSFIQKFAEMYLGQRSKTTFKYSEINESALYGNLNFSTDILKQIIDKNSVAIDIAREQGKTPAVLRDIYRSDLGELLMTYYFEEKLPEGDRFVIPIKNITFRERADMPGRGLDAIGFREVGNDKVEILLGEAKVSGSKRTPPQVVDVTSDSIFETHTAHRNETPIVIQRLAEYAKRLNTADAKILGFAIVCLDQKIDDVNITYGCTLIRDFECVNEASDFGKMKLNEQDFEPGNVHFSILSFSNKTIAEAVDLFYEKVQELIS